MKINEALKITDSFTRTSKMPGLSYSLPAWECKTGWKLSQVELIPGPVVRNSLRCGHCHWTWDQQAQAASFKLDNRSGIV